MTKADIIRTGLGLGVDYSMTSTCYDPTPEGVACGRCDACLLRLKGFAENGMTDPCRTLPIPARSVRAGRSRAFDPSVAALDSSVRRLDDSQECNSHPEAGDERHSAGERGKYSRGPNRLVLARPGGISDQDAAGKTDRPDPYLSNSCESLGQEAGFDMQRRFPPPLTPAQLVGVDLIVLTHSHQDHLDPQTLAGYHAAGGKSPSLRRRRRSKSLAALALAANASGSPGRTTNTRSATLHSAPPLPFRSAATISPTWDISPGWPTGRRSISPATRRMKTFSGCQLRRIARR